MALTFIVSRCYELVTPESAEDGDASERGFEIEDEEMDFREVIRELRNCNHLSDSHVQAGTWAMTEPHVSDWQTGEEKSESVHINAINGKPPTAHQLRRLFRAAGIKVNA